MTIHHQNDPNLPMTQELVELLQEEGLEPVKKLVPDKSNSTIHRWVHYGVRGIRLEAVLTGRTWETSKPALARFRARLTGQAIPTPIGTAGDLARRAAAAHQEIERMRRERRGKR
jgi:hypothetical protein